MESLTGEREPNRGRRPRQITTALAAVGAGLGLGTVISALGIRSLPVTQLLPRLRWVRRSVGAEETPIAERADWLR